MVNRGSSKQGGKAVPAKAGPNPAPRTLYKKDNKKPTVLVVVRTKDRPILLERAIKSIMQQSYGDLLAVVVNDGGDPGPVNKLLEKYSKNVKGRVKLINNKASVGMQNASNQAIKATESKYVTIHDDDDSWHPDFLRETVDFLERHKSMGVITGTIRVIEHIENGAVFTDRREVFEQRLEKVALHDMVKVNFFPPIAFVFRRTVFRRIGYFNEEFSVLGDWDFNLRFLRLYDIDIIPKPLAFYHHRLDLNADAQYRNSIVMTQGVPNVHMLHDIKARNAYLRKELDEKQVGLGFLVNIGQWEREGARTAYQSATSPPAPAAVRQAATGGLPRAVTWPVAIIFRGLKKPLRKSVTELFNKLEIRRNV